MIKNVAGQANQSLKLNAFTLKPAATQPSRQVQPQFSASVGPTKNMKGWNMTKARLILVGIGAFVIVIMILFPPYFVIDRQSNGRVHGSIGYHPIWKPPTSEYGYIRLHSKDPGAETLSKISKERLDSYDIRINKVGLTMQSILVVALVLVGMLIIKKRRLRSNKHMQLSDG